MTCDEKFELLLKLQKIDKVLKKLMKYGKEKG